MCKRNGGHLAAYNSSAGQVRSVRALGEKVACCMALRKPGHDYNSTCTSPPAAGR
jgi:hypothetical protein